MKKIEKEEEDEIELGKFKYIDSCLSKSENELENNLRVEIKELKKVIEWELEEKDRCREEHLKVICRQ